MEYYEAPSIQKINRKQVFPLIKWITKQKFEEYMQTKQEIYPYINSIDHEQTDITNRIYIGKTIQSNLNEGVNYGHDYISSNKNINLEIIGSVFKNLDNEWQLNVPHSSTVFEIKSDFLVLSIEDKNSFEWIETGQNNIPKCALRGCVDRLTNEYFYIGRPCSSSEKPSFYRGWEWNAFEESIIPNLFGKVHQSHSCLYVPHNKLELKFNKYEILCLKQSPAELKILSRLEIRKLLKDSNEKIQKINQNKSGRRYVPDWLLNFIKYPSTLSVGEYMLKHEKLVRSDGKFELLIENNGNLVCKSVITNRENLSEEEIKDRENTSIKHIIHGNVDSIWLHRFQIVFYKRDAKAFVVHNFFDKSPEYELGISESEIPNYYVKETTD